MKKKSLIILIFIIIYLISVNLSFNFIQKAYYDKDGRWNSLKPTSLDIFITIAPGYNTIIGINYLLGNWKNRELRSLKITIFKPK